MSPCEEQLKIADHYSGGELDDALATADGLSSTVLRKLAPTSTGGGPY